MTDSMDDKLWKKTDEILKNVRKVRAPDICTLNKMVSKLVDTNFELSNRVQQLEDEIKSLNEALDYYCDNVYRLTYSIVVMKDKFEGAKK